MKTFQKIKDNYKLVLIIVIASLIAGFFIGRSGTRQSDTSSSLQTLTETKQQVWTCSMHPQIREEGPGQCPICGMDLIPLEEFPEDGDPISANEIQMTETAMKIADIQTLVVEKSYPEKEVYLLGKVKPDERNISELTARFGGRIEKLFVNFTGQEVRQGDKLAVIYSPALVTAQKELLEATGYKHTSPELYQAVRTKLKLWDLSEEQIRAIEESGETKSSFDILSPINGTVTQRHVSTGDYVNEGSPLFKVIDLSKLWVMFEAYESDLPWIKKGDPVTFSIRSLPGKTFKGKVSFIDPLIDPITRVAQVRVEVDNRQDLLKPEMFADGKVISSIAGNKKHLLIPRTAVLWTGKRSVVYVKSPGREQPAFQYREIVLGPGAGDFYAVDEGLAEGEEIAVNGVFKIDAAAQLAGKPSMMNPEGGKVSTGHQHGEMERNVEMPSQEKPPSPDLFKEQLTAVLRSYLDMKESFVKSDPASVREKAGNVMQTISKVDMSLLSGKPHTEWMTYLGELRAALEKIAGTDNIEEQRRGFSSFNEAFYETIKEFGLADETVYYQYCPMAFGNQGAYWLSEKKEIENPYFGDAMLKCGETKETLKY